MSTVTMPSTMEKSLTLAMEKPLPPTPTINTISPKSPKPNLPALKTPRSATLPSELPRSPVPGHLAKSATLPSELPRSPVPGHLEVVKVEDDLKTPITPPTAYTEFLKALSPAVSTPSTGRSPIFDRLSGKSTPITQPSSAASCMCSGPDSLKASSAPIIPPSPYMRPPNSARTPTGLKRLRIPQSPAWSPSTDSPKSSARSSTIRSPFSPADWSIDGKTRYFEAPRSGTHRTVSVRQVVTKTITYTKSPITPLDPAPKGKKRRLE